MKTPRSQRLREALLDMAQLKCDELLDDMRFVLALYGRYKRGPITKGPDAERLGAIRRYLNKK